MEQEKSLMSPPTRRLPDSWVQKIFSTMQGHYGSRFMNMWSTGMVLPNGQDAGLVNAMNHWAEKLGAYVDRPEVIKRVLAHLPSEPPSLPQFVELCRFAYVPAASPQLENKLTEEQIAKNKERIREIIQKFNNGGNGINITGTRQ